MKSRSVASKAFAIVLLGSMTSNVLGQNSSLFQKPDTIAPVMPMATQTNPMATQGNREPLTAEQSVVPVSGSMAAPLGNPFAQASWTYMPTQTARKLKIHDIVSIRVDEATQSAAQGNASSRKNTIYDARLTDWVRFDGLALKTAPLSSGEPRVAGQENEVYRADSTVRTKQSLTFNIAAEIADIRPNGTIVLSAQKTVEDNDNVFDVSLSGICRADDIGPDNSILSRQISELHVAKNDRGHVRDGYSRGWFTRLLARVKPF